MGAKEKKIIDSILSNLDPGTERMFRFNAGMGWAGEVVKNTHGVMILKNPRVFHGAPTGFPDLAGWKSITITEDMVGHMVAVFVGNEVKATGNPSKAQRAFGELLSRMGGIFKVVRNEDQEDKGH